MRCARVIPRDLFNEADLLKCLGRLWIKLDERRDHKGRMVFYGAGERPFEVEQNPSDGSIHCRNVVFDLDGELSPEFWALIKDKADA